MRAFSIAVVRVCWTLLLLVGPPAALMAVTGNPLPAGPPDRGDWARLLSERPDQNDLAGLGVGLLWLLWAGFAALLVSDVIGQLRRRRAGRWPARGTPVRRAPGRRRGRAGGATSRRIPHLRAAITTGLGVTVVTTGTAAPVAAHTVTVAAATPTVDAEPAPMWITGADVEHMPSPQAGSPTSGHVGPQDVAPQHRGAQAGAGQRPAAGTATLTYEVVRGDWLGSIADRFLGDFNRYPELQDLNSDLIRHDSGPHGPDHIRPTWRLELPADAYDRGATRHATGQLIAEPPPTPPTGPHRPDNPPGNPSDGQPGTDAAPTTPPSVTTPPSAPAATPSTPRAGENQTPSSSDSPRPDSSSTEGPAPTTSPTADADGVVDDPAAASTPPTDPTAATTPSGSGGRTDAGEHPGSEHANPGIDIPGGWLTVTLAAALLAAAALVWRRRQRRYDPTEPLEPAIDPRRPDLQPPPPVVARIRRAVREQIPPVHGPLETRQQATDVPAPSIQRGRAPGTAPAFSPGSGDTAGNAWSSAEGSTNLAGWREAIPAGGLGLTGLGAEPAARALLTAALAVGDLADRDSHSQVIITADALHRLLGGQASDVPSHLRLVVSGTIIEALAELDERIIERHRLLQEHDADDLAQVPDPHARPPLPPVLLLTDAPRSDDLRDQLATSLRLGARLRINAVTLGAWPNGATITVDADGYTTDSRTTEGSTSNGRRLATLDIDSTMQLLRVLQEASQPPTSEYGAAPEDHDQQTLPTDIQPTDVQVTPAMHTADDRGEHTTDTELADSAALNPAPLDRPASGHPQRRGVRIVLLGPPTILRHDGAAVGGLRYHARQLLVYLAVHQAGADLPDIMEAFWPDATMERAQERLATEVANLRRRIREAAGDTTIQPVTNTGGRYVLNHDVLNIDLWHLNDAVRRAESTRDPQVQTEALQEAVAVHTGVLAEGQDYDWIEAAREHVRRQGIRARLQLATLLVEDDPSTAALHAHAAAELNPYSEAAAQHAIRVLAQAGDVEGIHARLDQLRLTLRGIDERPSRDTVDLVAQLTGAGQSARPAGSETVGQQRNAQ